MNSLISSLLSDVEAMQFDGTFAALMADFDMQPPELLREALLVLGSIAATDKIEKCGRLHESVLVHLTQDLRVQQQTLSVLQAVESVTSECSLVLRMVRGSKSHSA